MKRADPEEFNSALPPTRQEHALRIAGTWRKAVECYLEAGSLLIEAKKELDHGEFEAMVRDELPFSASTARKLMSIAAHPVIVNRAHVNDLPASWGTLYELSKLTKEHLESAIEHGLVTSKMERKDAVALLGRPVSIAASNEVASEEVHTEVQCAFCKEIKNTPVGHQWCDASEDQPASLEIVEDLSAQITKFLSYPKMWNADKITLRHKIDRIIEARDGIHPHISEELCGALRELGTTANELAAKLEAPIATVPADDEKLSSDSAQPDAVERVKKKPPPKKPGWRHSA
jgi:hypothetical protein